ncbi:MAG: phosphoesterase PA-phosphatase, partial [Planctomycetota bacterium]
MKKLSSFRASLLPHEVLFGAFLLVTWLHVIFSLGVLSVDSLVFTSMVVVNVVVLLLPLQGEGSWRWRVRLLFYPVAMNVAYLQMKTTIPRLHDGQLKDEFLQGLDELLVGGNLSL